MRTRRPLISAILAVALLLGQWLAATHGPDHGLQAGFAHDCAVCVYAHGAGAGALPALPVLRFEFTSAAPAAEIAATPVAAVLRLHPIRGPPTLLA